MSRLVQRKSLAVATVMVVLSGYSVWGPVGVAHADSLPGSAFEIETDANLVANGGIDWANASPLLQKQDVPSGTADDSLVQGSSEDDAVVTLDAGSIPNNKSDLKDFGLFVEKTATKSFLNVFWTRVQEPQGDTNMDFEFNQSATTNNKPAGSTQIIPVRTPGDLLLTYELSNGGAVATMFKRVWNGSAWGSPVTLTGSTSALGTVNSSGISLANSAGLGALSPRTFGEASVDFDALIPVSGGCVTYGSVYLKSRASDSFNAELKDFIAPMSASISNCGAVKIHKTDNHGAALQGAVFKLYTDNAPVGGSRGNEDTVTTKTCTTAANGDCTISDVTKGNYWVVETTTPAGYDTAADQHVNVTAGDQVFELTFVDPIQTGTIVVIKHATPPDGQDFTFSLDSTNFSLDDDADATLQDTRSFTVPVGLHLVTETNIPSGWALTSLSCAVNSGGTSTFTPNVQSKAASIALAKGDTVTCTFNDAFTHLGVNLQTSAVSAGGGAWNDSATLTGDGTHPVTGTVAFFACAPTTTRTACTTGGTAVGAPVSVTGSGTAYGASTTSTYTSPGTGWTCFRAEFTSTSSYYDNDSHTNADSECFVTAADLTASVTANGSFSRVDNWSISKSVDKTSVSIAQGGSATFAYQVAVSPNGYTDSGYTLGGIATVTNPNSFEAVTATVTVASSVGGGVTCTVTGGVGVSVPASSHVDLPYSCTFTGTPASGTVTATATWSAVAASTPSGSATGSAPASFAVGSEAHSTIAVVDDKTDPAHPVTLGTATWSAGTTAFGYSLTKSGAAGSCSSYTNTAVISETGQSASKTVSVCVGSDLTLSATAAGSFARTDLWSIAKSVDQTSVTALEGEKVTFNYTVTASPNGYLDSGFALGGTVTVSNPNNWESVTADVTVSSDLGGGSSCTVADGTGRSVPASGSIELTYTCSFTDTPALTGTVTATATWSQAAAATPSGSAGTTAAAALAMASETNATVTVADDKTDPANPVLLGVANWADGPTEFPYSIDKTASGTGCTTYTNVAQIAETEQSTSEDAEVCVFSGGGGTITPPTKGGGQLTFTGAETALLAQWAMTALAFGVLLVVLGRRRES